MKFFYDRKSDSLYLGLSETSQYRDSIEAAPGVVLDFDESGRLLGIDLERASRLIDVSDLELHEEPSGADTAGARLDGEKLRGDRERIGMSQLELARKLSVSPNTVARWERGELKIQHPGMLQLALSSLRSQARGRRTSPTKSRVARTATPYTKALNSEKRTIPSGKSPAATKPPAHLKTNSAKKKRGLTSR